MTQYEDDYDIDYTAPSPQGDGQKPSTTDQDLSLDPYDDLLDVDTLDDASWDEPMPAAQPRKAMKSGKAVKGSKKSSLFTPLLIGGAVLVGLGIIYFQFSGSSAPTTPSTMPAPLPTAEMPVDPNNPNAINPNGMPVPTDPNMTGGQQPVVPAQGDLLALQQAQNDPNAMLQPMPQDAQQPTPAPTGGLLNDPNLLPQAQAPTMPMANDVQKAETVTPTAPPATDPTAVTAIETPPAPAPAIVPEPAPTPAPVAEAPKEAVAVQPTAAATPAPTPTPDTTTISNKELEDMRATIARLESKIKELESKPVETAATTSTSSSSNLADEVAPAPKKKTTAKKKTTSSTSSKKKPSDAGYIAKAKTPAKSSSWELRGIAGGEAIVAKRGSEDFQTIGVGDTLSGVGTITSISNQNGAWVIEGTNGKIRQ